MKYPLIQQLGGPTAWLTTGCKPWTKYITKSTFAKWLGQRKNRQFWKNPCNNVSICLKASPPIRCLLCLLFKVLWKGETKMGWHQPSLSKLWLQLSPQLIWLWNGEGFGGFLLLPFCSHYLTIDLTLEETVWVGFCCSHFVTIDLNLKWIWDVVAPIISLLIWLWNGFEGDGLGGILLLPFCSHYLTVDLTLKWI